MTQEMLPIQHQSEKNDTSLTSFAGLPLYIDWIMAIGLNQVINETMRSKARFGQTVK